MVVAHKNGFFRGSRSGERADPATIRQRHAGARPQPALPPLAGRPDGGRAAGSERSFTREHTADSARAHQAGRLRSPTALPGTDRTPEAPAVEPAPPGHPRRAPRPPRGLRPHARRQARLCVGLGRNSPTNSERDPSGLGRSVLREPRHSTKRPLLAARIPSGTPRFPSATLPRPISHTAGGKRCGRKPRGPEGSGHSTGSRRTRTTATTFTTRTDTHVDGHFHF